MLLPTVGQWSLLTYHRRFRLDQTTRIHGPVALQPVECWHELARPQVHGYDLVGVGFLSALNYVSVADEKVARVFEAPKSFVHNIQHFGIAEVLEQEVFVLSIKCLPSYLGAVALGGKST